MFHSRPGFRQSDHPFLSQFSGPTGTRPWLDDEVVTTSVQRERVWGGSDVERENGDRGYVTGTTNKGE